MDVVQASLDVSYRLLWWFPIFLHLISAHVVIVSISLIAWLERTDTVTVIMVTVRRYLHYKTLATGAHLSWPCRLAAHVLGRRWRSTCVIIWELSKEPYVHIFRKIGSWYEPFRIFSQNPTRTPTNNESSARNVDDDDNHHHHSHHHHQHLSEEDLSDVDAVAMSAYSPTRTTTTFYNTRARTRDDTTTKQKTNSRLERKRGSIDEMS